MLELVRQPPSDTLFVPPEYFNLEVEVELRIISSSSSSNTGAKTGSVLQESATELGSISKKLKADDNKATDASKYSEGGINDNKSTGGGQANRMGTFSETSSQMSS